MTKPIFKPGIHLISNEEYHAAEGISRSALWAFKQLPQKYWYEYLSGEYVRPPEKEAFLVGDMVHTLLLEPQMFDERYLMTPNIDKRTKAGKAIYEGIMEAALGREIISVDQFELARAMVDSLENQSIVRDIVSKDAKIEHSIFWIDEETGVLCKARPDIWNNPICGDLKTTLDASYRAFQYSALKYGYFLQAAMIYEALKSIGESYEKFLFMCVEKNLPHAVGLYLLDDEALQFGLDQFHSLLRKFAECQYKNEWPDYGIQMLMVPKYATMEFNNEQ